MRYVPEGRGPKNPTALNQTNGGNNDNDDVRDSIQWAIGALCLFITPRCTI